MIRPFVVRYADAAPDRPASGLVHTWTAFAAIGKFLMRHHKMRARSRWIALADADRISATPVRPYRAHDRAFYAADIDHARRIAGGGVVRAGDHYDCLFALDPWTLVNQGHYLWPAAQTARESAGMLRYAPAGANRSLLYNPERSKRMNARSRASIATAVCLAIADPWRAAPLPARYRHPNEPRFSSPKGVSALARVHPDVDRSLLDELVRTVGYDLTYPPSVLALVRRFCEALGEDPETLRWSEIRALLRGGHRALDAHRIEGGLAEDFFTDRRR